MPSIETIVLQVNRLYDNFAAATSRSVRDTKVKLFQRELSRMSDDKFIQICGLLIKDSKTHTFPTVSDFFGISRDLRQQTEKDNPYCDACDNTGYYTIWQRRQEFEKYYNFVYKCCCNIDSTAMPTIYPDAVPLKPHNPFPPSDPRHKHHNLRLKN
ncbi:MAG: hypothetical protein A2W17_01460 [Planctomycetes bacterium RBG_16_41_13]|nr:MAG: hypothetical protein A2W17_01460 [Planctomycetes bacterium RBG_16_41_13]